MRGRPPDRPCWTTLADGPTLGALPDGWKGLDAIGFYKKLGCDILQLGGWGTPFDFASPGFRWGGGIGTEESGKGSERTRKWRFRGRELVAVTHTSGHPLKYPVETPEDLGLYREMWEGASYLEADDRAVCGAVGNLVGDGGIVARMWGPSTIPRLLEYDMGTENFYSLLEERPGDMKALFGLMHRKELAAFAALAKGPCDVAILTENTSTFYISPEVYREHNGPYVRDFVETMHQNGKVAIIHMCGHIRAIMGLIRETGLDGVHALTPPPTGDTPYEAALDALGEDKAIIGALDPTIFLGGPVEKIGPALDALYTPRLRKAPFVLCPFADGIPVPLERFLAVRDWMEKETGKL